LSLYAVKKKKNQRRSRQLKIITQELLGESEDNPKSQFYLHNDHTIRQ